PENRGIVEALNLGLDECRGEWIARMDADDRMLPDRLRLQRNYFDEHPKTDLLGARVGIFRDDAPLTPGQIQYRDWSNSLLDDRAIKTDMFAESPVMHPTFFLEKHFYRKMGGYQDNPWAEDYDFLLRAYLEDARFAKLPQVLLEKRDSPTRLARTDDRCKRKAMFRAKAHYFVKKDWLKGKERVLVAGSGSAGRMARTALKGENFRVDGFINNIPGGEGRTVAGLPAYTLDTDKAESFFAGNRKTFFILCIGMQAGREMMETLLQRYGFSPGIDYLRFI
ncbi:MAG: glycosyltransferase, partial [Proteobacteria bacterium]|nr:glycosyltransferase [Pseudomonadota bacterium]